MLAHPVRLGAVLAALGLASFASTSALAAPGCSGEACEALTLSTDGCAWQNSSAKAVRFQLLLGSETLISTVLPPGTTFRETEKKACISAEASSPRYEASFAALRKMPDAPDFTLKAPPSTTTPKIAVPRIKPQQTVAVAADATSAAAVAAPTTAAPPQVASVAARVIPKPRAKPDLPELKSVPGTQASATPDKAPQLVTAPTAQEIAAGANPCGDACSEILFTRLDDCIWVQSQNPRPILFQATVAGHMIVLPLEGANAAKANPSTKPPEGAASYHTRLRDPFVSTSDGIPVFRARLGEKGSCAADRTQISQFVAVYKK